MVSGNGFHSNGAEHNCPYLIRAKRAVEAANQYLGTEITIDCEAGLQALARFDFSGPKWKELTVMDAKVIEVSAA